MRPKKDDVLEPIYASYAGYPKDIPVRTRFGDVRVSVTDGNHLHVDFCRPEHPLMVAGQAVWGGLHLWRQADGSFSPDGRPHGGFVDRFEPRVGFDRPASKTVTARLFEVLLSSMTEWAHENEVFFREAVRGRREATKNAVREEIARLEEALRYRRDELARLEAEER